MGQPAAVPGEFLERVTRWAEAQSNPVSVILFGSRARGDHRAESDWDIALVYEGEAPSLDGLPHSLEDGHIDWAPMERSRVLRRLNVSGLAHAVAGSGRCLHGDPLPPPERNDMNIPDAWELLLEAHIRMGDCLHGLTRYWRQPSIWREGYDTSAAERSALAGELLCKAVLSLRGVEPRRSHSVAELCEDLERADPADPLLPLLRERDGGTPAAHVGVYTERATRREGIGVSADRLVGVLRASGEVSGAVGEASRVDEGSVPLQKLTTRRAELFDELARLKSSACPPETLRRLRAGLEAAPSLTELRNRLRAAPPRRHQERAGRGGGSRGR